MGKQNRLQAVHEPGPIKTKLKLYERVGIRMEDIDATLREVVESDEALSHPSLVYDGIMQLIAAGGKRLRPILVMVGSRFGKPGHEERVRRTSALLEYMHMASLVHDDMIDDADLRRGAVTLHRSTDVRTAVHTANYMMARAVEWAAAGEDRQRFDGVDGLDDDDDEDLYRSAQIASIVTDLCIGEYGQLYNRFNFDLTMAQYEDKTKRKTALLMAECLRAGATAAEADERTRSVLYRFGEALGMSFQIRDDVLDYTSRAEAVGKPVGADLRSGNITLPALLALSDPDAAVVIRRLSAESTEEQLQEALAAIIASGAVDQAMAIARGYGEQARILIRQLGEHPACAELHLLADYFIGE